MVTTERRIQSIQDVSASVQTFTGYEMQNLGVGTDFRNLQTITPGLHMTNQEGHIEIFLRGIGSTNNDFSSDPAVATHYNGVYIGRPRGIGLMFFDLERSEINKGPQGTLRGRNATGGSINIIPQKPDLYDVSGYLRAGVGNFSGRQFEGALNIPLISNKLALRGAILHQAHTAYVSNALNNGVEGPGAEDDLAARLSGRWEPTSFLKVHAVFDYSNQNGTGNPGQFWGGALSAGYNTSNLDNPRSQFFLQEGLNQNEIIGLNLKTIIDIDTLRFETSSAYRTYNFYSRNHQRPFQQGIAYPGVNLGTLDLDNFSTLYQLESSDSFINEFRIVSPDTAQFKWNFGFFHYLEHFGRVSWDVSDKQLNQNALGGYNVTLPDSSVESWAGYGDITWDIIQRLRVKVGARLTYERKQDHSVQTQFTFNFPNATNADLRLGTPGFQLRGPRELRITQPASVDPRTQLLDAIAQFGARDTLDGFLTVDASDTITRNITDQTGTNRTTYNAQYGNWRAGLEFDLSPQNLLYLTLATGTRSGGINPTVELSDGTRLPTTFDPENLWSLELGTKNEFVWGGYRTIVNAVAFGYRYFDQVLQTLIVGDRGVGDQPGQQNFLANTNVGESLMLGLELEGRSELPFGFSLNWNLTYLNSEYQRTLVNESRLLQEADFIDYDQDGDTTEALPRVLVNLQGGPLQNVSTWNAAVGLKHIILVNWGWFDWQVNYLYRSTFFYTPFGGRGFDFLGNEIPIAEMPRPTNYPDQNGRFLSDRVPDVHLLNANVGLNIRDGDIRLEGYITNATNHAYTTKGFVNPFVNIRFLNPPRTFGGNFSWTF